MDGNNNYSSFDHLAIVTIIGTARIRICSFLNVLLTYLTIAAVNVFFPPKATNCLYNLILIHKQVALTLSPPAPGSWQQQQQRSAPEVACTGLPLGWLSCSKLSLSCMIDLDRNMTQIQVGSFVFFSKATWEKSDRNSYPFLWASWRGLTEPFASAAGCASPRTSASPSLLKCQCWGSAGPAGCGLPRLKGNKHFFTSDFTLLTRSNTKKQSKIFCW